MGRNTKLEEERESPLVDPGANFMRSRQGKFFSLLPLPPPLLLVWILWHFMTYGYKLAVVEGEGEEEDPLPLPLEEEEEEEEEEIVPEGFKAKSHPGWPLGFLLLPMQRLGSWRMGVEQTGVFFPLSLSLSTPAVSHQTVAPISKKVLPPFFQGLLLFYVICIERLSTLLSPLLPLAIKWPSIFDRTNLESKLVESIMP